MVSLWHSFIAHMCYFQRKSVFVRLLLNTNFLSSGLRGSGKVNLLASQIFSNVVVTSPSLCVFLYLFSSANISPVRFVLHLQDWWCVGKRETSFPVNKLWLTYLPPSLWPITMKIVRLMWRMQLWFFIQHFDIPWLVCTGRNAKSGREMFISDHCLSFWLVEVHNWKYHFAYVHLPKKDTILLACLGKAG